jgi:hypothetical protein
MCAGMIAPAQQPAAQQTPTQQPAAQQPAAAEEKPKLKAPGELDSLVAPIALYPDPLLAQVLAASTYPLEIVQAQRWLTANAKLKGEELTKAAAKQTWDPSVQALVAFPDALKLLDTNLDWTTEVGNAFLDQQADVMDAIQRMRKKAKDAGKLETSKEQKVEVKTVETKTVIEIQPANPQVIYVPTYQPTVVYGAPPVYAYPPVTYPSAGAVAATAAVSFGVGVMMGAMWSGCCHGGGYGWGMGWGGNTVVVNNNFNTRYGYTNINAGNRTNINTGNINTGNIGSGNRTNNSWQHNSSHRGAVPYNNRSTAQRYNGTGGGASSAAQRTDRAAQNRGAQAADRSAGNRAQSGQDRVGDRSVGSDSGRHNAFGGAESKARTQAASDRGFASSRESRGGSGGSSARSSGGGSRSSGARSGGGGGRRRR